MTSGHDVRWQGAAPSPGGRETGGEHKTRAGAPARDCKAPGCPRTAIARDLCMMHYKRARAGRPLTDREVGSQSGFGLYGVLDVDETSVLCHECGERFASVGAHLARSHEMTAAEYRAVHGIPRTVPLISRSMSTGASERAKARLDTAGWRRLEDARDPAAASAARDQSVFDAVAATHRRTPERARAAGKSTRKARVTSCPVCEAQWCPLPGGYGRITCSKNCWATLASWIRAAQPRSNQARDEKIIAAYGAGGSYADLSRIHGITKERVGQIIRTHRQP